QNSSINAPATTRGRMPVLGIRPRHVIGSERPGRTPSTVVLGASGLRIRNRTDDRAHCDLLMGLDRGLPGSAVRLAPDDTNLGTDRNVAIDGGERQTALLIG